MLTSVKCWEKLTKEVSPIITHISEILSNILRLLPPKYLYYHLYPPITKVRLLSSKYFNYYSNTPIITHIPQMPIYRSNTPVIITQKNPLSPRKALLLPNNQIVQTPTAAYVSPVTLNFPVKYFLCKSYKASLKHLFHISKESIHACRIQRKYKENMCIATLLQTKKPMSLKLTGW